MPRFKDIYPAGPHDAAAAPADPGHVEIDLAPPQAPPHLSKQKSRRRHTMMTNVRRVVDADRPGATRLHVNIAMDRLEGIELGKDRLRLRSNSIASEPRREPLSRGERYRLFGVAIMTVWVIIGVVLIGRHLDNHESYRNFHAAAHDVPFFFPLATDEPLHLVEVLMEPSTLPEEVLEQSASEREEIVLTVSPARQTGSHTYQAFGKAKTVKIEKESRLTVLEFHDFKNEPDSPRPGVLITTDYEDAVAFYFRVEQLDESGDHQALIGGIILIVVYVAIVFDVVHRTLAAFLGMLVTVGVLVAFDKTPDLEEAIAWLDEGVIVLLFAMMVIVHVISTTGLFDWIAIQSYVFSKGSLTRLFLALSLLTAVFSAFLDNVTTILLMVPVTIQLAEVLEISPVPFLMAETLMSNVGGTGTMIGDPPNIIIGNQLRDHIGFVDFLWNLLPAVVLMSPLVLLYIWLRFRKELTGTKTLENLSELKRQYCITDYFLLYQCLIVFGGVLLLFFLQPLHNVDPAWLALLGAVSLLLLATPHELQKTLEAIEWDTLLFFSALFIMIEGLAELGLIRWIGDTLSDIISSAGKSDQLLVAILLLIWVSGIVSAFLDNIPYTATLVPIILQLSRDLDLPIRPLAWALCFGACLGGNGTLVGASANIVTAGIAARHGYEISFKYFMSFGAPVAGISMAVATVYSIIVYTVLDVT